MMYDPIMETVCNNTAKCNNSGIELGRVWRYDWKDINAAYKLVAGWNETQRCHCRYGVVEQK